MAHSDVFVPRHPKEESHLAALPFAEKCQGRWLYNLSCKLLVQRDELVIPSAFRTEKYKHSKLIAQWLPYFVVSFPARKSRIFPSNLSRRSPSSLVQFCGPGGYQPLLWCHVMKGSAAIAHFFRPPIRDLTWLDLTNRIFSGSELNTNAGSTYHNRSRLILVMIVTQLNGGLRSSVIIFRNSLLSQSE